MRLMQHLALQRTLLLWLLLTTKARLLVLVHRHLEQKRPQVRIRVQTQAPNRALLQAQQITVIQPQVTNNLQRVCLINM